MRYEILGPLRVTDDGGSHFISARKVQVLLALLLVRSRQIVSIDDAIGEIWGEESPRRATAGVHVYISQIRKFLARPGRPDSPVVTRPPGYLLQLDDDEFDVHLFQALLHSGRGHLKARRATEAVSAFESALALWRGPVLDNLGAGPVIEGFATWLGETRLECVELLVDAQLSLGAHRELVGRLYSLTAEHPLREAFYRQLMLALCRSERQADALRVYQQARTLLREELGLEPCRALRELQRAILVADERLDRAMTAFGPSLFAAA
ncbi:BTAD domain-containing putative transcriptional regulator [Micromonospora sp. NPDC048898]|uniref:AfsR/SARP family transcriptional regulator n=1 Tax=Micromonospora sp. NPDC048898 TaxID=3364260 RepID=UPI003717CF71